MVTPLPGWAFGTMLGVIAGNIMSPRMVSAFSVALFGMFIAIIIPPSKQNKVVAGLVTLAFISSFAATCLPWISTLSDGTRTIILTVALQPEQHSSSRYRQKTKLQLQLNNNKNVTSVTQKE